MNMFQEINAARKLLELPQHATLEEIKANYRALVQKWHPDRCEGDKERCQEMTARIIAAYRLINDYCRNYKFSFSREEVSRYVSVEEWWFDRFGGSPLWGNDQKPKKP